MKRAYGLAIFSIVLWATYGSVSAMVVRGEMTHTEVIFYISLLSTLVLVIICGATGRLKELKKISAKMYLELFGIGLLGIFFYNEGLFIGLDRMKVQQASTVNYMWPLMIVIFSTFILDEVLTAKKIIAIMISFIGVIYVVTEGDFTQLVGIDYVGFFGSFAGACSYGLFSCLTLKTKVDKLLAMMLYSFSSTVICIPLLIAQGGLMIPSGTDIIGLLWIGGILDGVVYSTWLIALDIGDTAKISNMAYLTPCISLFFIWLLLGEPINPASYIGLGIVLVGIGIQLLPEKADSAHN